MTKAVPKITLSSSRDIPFDKLVLSQSNVRHVEAKGQRAADRIEHLKKVEMATGAEVLLAGSGWLPEPLRTPARFVGASDVAEPAEAAEPSGPPIARATEDGGERATVDPEFQSNLRSQRSTPTRSPPNSRPTST